ncbi:nucleotide exchange factor GrpE [Accumulibacter sp.]|jgi:molecular chaperone GrpE|uniref:nucleotide exchange factor GrpE n=1 Tax=Accumulibacter sp. TaxID=2053492 RepID=UPI001AD2A8A1|nr:nucleotide exchange factor GrpE [Accumulibacter sp.]MBN8453346.1 nucleotide exchange factor GrpE [Accumulibacter sp.]MBO3706728.1 nucleotide exchange factor GrpE [Candidatus Accumulibacter conexus]
MQSNETAPEERAVAAAAAAVESPAVGEAAAAEPPQAEDNGVALQEELQQARLKANEYQDLWLRAKAETENVRRRAQEDIAKAAKFAVDRFARELLPVKDSLEAALATEKATVESMRAGSELTLKQLIAAFEKSALTEINPVGEKFDPNRHQAISVVESGQEANTVVTVLQKGYLLAERVLRPALVIVAKAAS